MLHLQNRLLPDILTLTSYSRWSLGGDQQVEQEDWPDRQRPQPRQGIHRPLALEAMMGCLSRDNTPSHVSIWTPHLERPFTLNRYILAGWKDLKDQR